MNDDFESTGDNGLFAEGPTRKNANVKVLVRCRPPLEGEIKQGNTFDKLRLDPNSRTVR